MMPDLIETEKAARDYAIERYPESVEGVYEYAMRDFMAGVAWAYKTLREHLEEDKDNEQKQ
jgi:hypothetical protein